MRAASTERRDPKLRDTIKYAIERINREVVFTLHKVPQTFHTRAAFAKLKLKLATHNDGVTRKAVLFTTLFGIDPAEIEMSDAVKFLHRCKSWPWPPTPLSPAVAKKRGERSIMMDIATEILRHLCIAVTLERRYAGHHTYTASPSPVTGLREFSAAACSACALVRRRAQEMVPEC